MKSLIKLPQVDVMYWLHTSKTQVNCRTASAVPWNHRLPASPGVWVAAKTCASSEINYTLEIKKGTCPKNCHGRNINSPKKTRFHLSNKHPSQWQSILDRGSVWFSTHEYFHQKMSYKDKSTVWEAFTKSVTQVSKNRETTKTYMHKNYVHPWLG